jgi:hypothetical protein
MRIPAQNDEDKSVYRGVLEQTIESAKRETEPIAEATANSMPK